MKTIKIGSLGIELEGGMDEQPFKELLEKWSSTKRVDYTYDGSVYVKNKQIRDLELHYWSKDITDVFEFIKDAWNYGLQQNETCGNHLHFRFRPQSSAIAVLSFEETWNRIIREYTEQFQGNDKYLQRLQNRYCEARYSETGMMAFFERDGGDIPRYKAINFRSLLESQKTIEFRLLPWAESAQELIDAIKWTIITFLKVLNSPLVIIRSVSYAYPNRWELLKEITYEKEVV